MLKEICAASALAAAALVPSTASQAAQAEKVRAVATPAKSTSLTNCTSWHAPKCKWFEEENQRCLYCRVKKGSGYKKHYCEKKEKKPTEPAKPPAPTQRDCATVADPLPGRPGRKCSICTDLETGKIISKECFGN
ncbi:hypothetical protein ACTMTI_52040 [Nonomuraea sp. H19]|uniref:hypothetical protein n=1 Tax=Nonomuraea sp. H19 TaxID=3452206 RepID=UPI003F8A458A